MASAALRAPERGDTTVIDRPLGGFERQFWIWGRIASINVGAAVRLRGAVEPEALRAALHALQRRHPLLRARIVHRQGPRWAEGAPPAPLRVLPRTGPEQWRDLAMPEADAPFPDEGPLLRATLLRGADGSAEHDLLLVHHHAIADGFGTHRMLCDLLDDLAGRPLPPVPDPGPHEALLPPGTKPPSTPLVIAKFLGRIAAKRPVRMPWEGQAPAFRRRTGMAHRLWDGAATAALVRRCKQEGATVTGALAASMLQSTAAELAPGRAANLGWVSQVDVRRAMVGLRPEMLGCYAFGLPFFHRAGAGVDFWDLAREAGAAVQEATDRGVAVRAVASRGRVPRTAAGEAAKLERLSRFSPLTFGLSNMARLPDLPACPGLEVEAVRLFTGLAVAGAGTSMNCQSYRGALAIHHFWPAPLVSDARGHRIAAGSVQHLLAAVA